MTTILANERGIWADSRVLESGDMVSPNPQPKVIRENGWLIGVAGELAVLTLYRRWAMENFRIGKEPRGIDEWDSSCVALCPTGLLTFDSGVPTYGYPPVAIGSGAYYAMGALMAGASPERAVEVAIQLDPYSGGGVSYYALDRHNGK